MALYEHVYLARQDVSAQQVDALVEQYKGVIESLGGKVGRVENWGLKSLTYRIKKNRKAHYALMDIDAPAAAIHTPEYLAFLKGIFARWQRIEGAVQKYLKEVSLLDQVFVKAADGKQTVGQYLKATNTTVKGFTLYVVGEGIEKKVDDFAAEVAAQVAAAKGA